MRKIIFLAGIAISFIAAPAFAEPASKEENIGIGTGVVLGAVAGGPVGALIGAAFGARIGDNYHDKGEQVDRLTASLNSSQSQVAQLESDIRSLNGEMAGLDSEVERLRSTSNPQLVSLMQAGIAMDLLFRTDEDTLSDETGSKLQQFATTLASMQDVQIRLDGFADERGDADYNQQLSERRAQHVRDTLVANGIPESRIQVNGHGETPAVDQNIDSFALDRKVSLTLYVDETTSFASNP